MGLIGKSDKRTRRPTDLELDKSRLTNQTEPKSQWPSENPLLRYFRI